MADAAPAPQPLGAGGIGQADRAVVDGGGGIVAPAVLPRDRIGREPRRRRGEPVRAIEQAPHRPAAGGRLPVAPALVGADASAPQGAAQAFALPNPPPPP